MAVFKDVGNFFTKEIPKFFTQTIPSAFEPETYAPDLVPLRKEVADLKDRVEDDRERFYEEQSALKTAIARYRQISDDFAAHAGENTDFDIDKTDRLVRELDEGERIGQDIAQGLRIINNVLTLGLVELAYVHKDIDEERKTLRRQRTILTGTSRRFRHAIDRLVSAREAVETQITQIEAQLAAAGIEAGASSASELTAAKAAQSARRDMAARLLGLGTDAGTIAVLTGLTEAEIASIEAVQPDPDDGSFDAEALLTDEERQLISEQN